MIIHLLKMYIRSTNIWISYIHFIWRYCCIKIELSVYRPYLNYCIPLILRVITLVHLRGNRDQEDLYSKYKNSLVIICKFLVLNHVRQNPLTRVPNRPHKVSSIQFDSTKLNWILLESGLDIRSIFRSC